MIVGLILFVGLIILSVVLVSQKKIPQPIAVLLIVVAVISPWIIPKMGTGFRVEFPGGGKLETLVERAEDAASKAVASKEEVERLAEQIKQAQARIEKVQDDLRIALKSIAESLYLTNATRNIFPTPSFVSDRILKNVNDIAIYVFPDEKQRDPWISEMTELVRRAHSVISMPPVPHRSP